MPGYPPPPDEPSVEDQGLVDADASFEPGPTAVSICGFKLPIPPVIKFSFGIKLPPINIPIPKFSFAFGINCDLDNPFDVSGGVEWGGGRKAMGPRDPDDVDAEKYMRT